MPIVMCDECGGKVATSAPNCPHCGAKRGGTVLREKTSKGIKAQLFFAGLVIAVGVAITVFGLANGAASGYSNPYAREPNSLDYLPPTGGVVAFGGVAWYCWLKIVTWWRHG